MRVRGSEISADYVRRLRDKGRSWSVIARMTGASEIDLRRFHGGLELDRAALVPAVNTEVVVQRVSETIATAPQPVRTVRGVGRSNPETEPKAKAARKKNVRSVLRKPTKADARLGAVLVAAGMGHDEADVVVRMYRAGGKRLMADELVPEGRHSPSLTKTRMAAAKISAARLGIQFSGGRGGYCLRPDSMHFVGRLEAVNCGGAR